MKIEKVKIKNFKKYDEFFEVSLSDGVNVVVGDNEAGKSTIVEAIHLALTGLLNGRYLRNELSSYLFNRNAEQRYLDSLKSPEPSLPPEIIIELYFQGDSPELANLEGDGNSDKTKASGVRLKVEFDDTYKPDYAELCLTGEVNSIPIEFYKVSWESFRRQPITARSIPIKSALIDSSSLRGQNGSDIYISRIIRENLEDKEKVAISQAHRQMREQFMGNESVANINKKINESAKITNKKVSISVDLSTQSAWESSLMTYIDEIPFQNVGRGEQCLIKTKLALSNKKASEATVILIEEPENHLSHSRLNRLIADISEDNGDKQIIITTHNSFVANKLGLDKLILLRGRNVVPMNDLESSDFFKKLSGYDTLRLILSAKSILVEGDSDELTVQRAYRDSHQGRLPIMDEIDVISVGTSFLRFLEIAKHLQIRVAVVTDNDGDVEAVERKFQDYANLDHMEICYDRTVDEGNLEIGGKPYNYNTLEPKILKTNSRKILQEIFGREFDSDDSLRKYMQSRKTECALSIFQSRINIQFPEYIEMAIKI